MAGLYLDEDVTEDLAALLRAYGHSVTTTTGAGQKGTRDHEQLWFTATRAWTMITVNRRDFESLHGAWLLWGVSRPHAGIIILHHLAESDLPRIATEINDLVTNSDAFFAARIRVGTTPTVTPVMPITNHLYRRFRDGTWDCIG